MHVWVEILCTWPLQAPLWSAVGTPELRKLSWWIDVETLSVQATCLSCANWTLSTIILLCKLLWFPFSTKFLECRSSQVVKYIMIRTPDGPWMEQRGYRLVAITQESSRVGLNESRSEISTSLKRNWVCRLKWFEKWELDTELEGLYGKQSKASYDSSCAQVGFKSVLCNLKQSIGWCRLERSKSLEWVPEDQSVFRTSRRAIP